MNIKVFGPGCSKCVETEKIIKNAIEETGVDASVEKVSDFQEIAKHGVFSTTAVLIDGQIKCAGKVLGRKAVLGWLK